MRSMRSSTSAAVGQRSPSPIQEPIRRKPHPIAPPASPIGPSPVPKRADMAAWSRRLAASRNSATTRAGSKGGSGLGRGPVYVVSGGPAASGQRQQRKPRRRLHVTILRGRNQPATVPPFPQHRAPRRKSLQVIGLARGPDSPAFARPCPRTGRGSIPHATARQSDCGDQRVVSDLRAMGFPDRPAPLPRTERGKRDAVLRHSS